MSLDLAMGGSTNTVLHLLAIANEAGVEFSMNDIDELSRKVPVLCKVSPNGKYHIQDVNRAGGVMRILGELERGGLLDTSVCRIDSEKLAEVIQSQDIIREEVGDDVLKRCLSAPGFIKSGEMASQENYYDNPDKDFEAGCIRSIANAYAKEGGLAVLYGNLAPDGCIIKSAGVDSALYKFKGTAVVFESQEEASEGILSGKVKKGDVVVIRYEGPKGGPGMQEMLYPTAYLKSMKLEKTCALITDGRFSGGSSGLVAGHISPEAAAGGNIALVQNGDRILIDIPHRKIVLEVSEEELMQRRSRMQKKGRLAFTPENRKRDISKSLKAYALNVSSADRGAVRIID